MKSIQFLGASGTVTGSGYLLTTEDNQTALIDFGMFQETGDILEYNYQPVSFDPATLDAVFLTHAHLDHCGRLPVLINHGFRGKIYLTEATKAITALSLMDAAGIAAEDKQHTPLYTKEDVNKTIQHMETITLGQTIATNAFIATFYDAGHILGSASIKIAAKGKADQSIIFSGDLGNTPEDLIQPTEPISQASIVVMETTYGDRVHPTEDASKIIQDEINTIEKTDGVLLIPAFSIERTQEILHRLYHLQKDKKILPTTAIFLDSPMAIHVTEIFEKFPALYNNELAHDQKVFTFPNLTFTLSSEESKAIFKHEGPKVIIAGSGMMSGGRILHHLQNYASLTTTRILIVGYQAVDTLGREILEGAKTVTINKQQVKINATITSIESLSSHADQPKLLHWLQQIKDVEKIFLVHGEDSSRKILAEEIRKTLGIENIFLPEKEQIYSLSEEK
jgi:metallo-beta-lactamase family protein